VQKHVRIEIRTCNDYRAAGELNMQVTFLVSLCGGGGGSETEYG